MDWRNNTSCVLVVFIEPILCVIGFLLNVTCILVFFSVSSNSYFRKTSLLLYLAALTFCNSLQLLLSIFVLILPAAEQFIQLKYPEEAESIRRMNTRTVRVCYPFMLAANYAAIWLLVLICAQRFQAICPANSVWKKRLFFVRRSRLAVFTVAVISIGLNMIRFWEMEWLEEQLADTHLRDNMVYKIMQEGIGYGLFVYALPMLVLLWLNFNICKLIRTKQIHVQIQNRRPAEYRTALMTVCVFISFALTATLSASLRLFIIATNPSSPSMQEALFWLMDVSNLLMNVNALVTPILYFVFTRAFRDLFLVIRFKPPPCEVGYCSQDEKSLVSDRPLQPKPY